MTTPSPLPARLAATALALALSACITIPPDRHAVAERPLPAALAEPGLSIAPDAWPSPAWWSRYHDARLDALIEQGLRSASSLEAARARIDAAYAALALQQAQHGGQAELDAGVNRQRFSANGLFPEPIGGSFHNDFSLGLRGSYDFDWWGKHRSLVSAALGEANARKADQAQARQVMAATIARSYFDLQFLRARQANVGEQRKVAQALLADRQKRIARGLARIDEQRAAELDLARLEQQDARLAAAAARERELLRSLAGGPSNLELEPLAPVAAAAAHVVPDTLGMQLLAHRADLQAARYRVEAALGRIAASQAAFYPDLNLAGSIGLDAGSLTRLLRAGSLTVLAESALKLPLFDNGRLGAALDTVRAQRDEVIADYNQAVANAARDVALQAQSLRGVDEELARQGAASRATASLLASARLRAARGLGDRATALQAEAAVLVQLDTALQLRQAQRQAEILLNQTLGGGYDAAAIPPTPSIAERRHD